MSLHRSPKTQVFDKALAVLDLRAGEKQVVLDIGCGTGEFLGRLAQVVGSDSKLIGLDAMERSIEQAKIDHPNMEFMCFRFNDRLPFSNDLFDVVVSIDTIECIKDKDALISEVHRVLKPHGKVLAMHWDWDTQTYSVKNTSLARKAISAFADWKQPWMDECDGQMGRKLWGLFEGIKKFHGRPDTFCLLETKYELGNYGFDRMQDLAALVQQAKLDTHDYEALRNELSENHVNGQYLYSLTSFIYLGERI